MPQQPFNEKTIVPSQIIKKVIAISLVKLKRCGGNEPGQGLSAAAAAAANLLLYHTPK